MYYVTTLFYGKVIVIGQYIDLTFMQDCVCNLIK